MKAILSLILFTFLMGGAQAHHIIYRYDLAGDKVGFEGVYFNNTNAQIQTHINQKLGTSYKYKYFSSPYVLVFRYQFRGKWIYNHYTFHSKAAAEKSVADRRKYEHTFPSHGKYHYEGIFYPR